MLKMHPITRPGIAGLVLAAGLLAAAVLSGPPVETPDAGLSAAYIVQGESLEDAHMEPVAINVGVPQE